MTGSGPAPAAGGFARRLLAWYDAHGRDLPWRRRPEPWPVWVSEVMAQQTRLDVVVPAWRRFLADYPTPADWAGADDDALQRAWRGLGYYRRARLLRDGARAVVTRHGGRVPDDPDALRALPGIGEYTGAAISAIAFGRPAVALDGNLERVLARHARITEPIKKAAGRRALRAAADARFAPERAGDWNQALMDLGSLICTPRRPACARCPVAADCAAEHHGETDRLPLLPPRRAAVPVRAAAAWIDAGRGRIWARRIPAGEVNAGQLDLPGPGALVEMASADDLAAEIATRWPGVAIALLQPRRAAEPGTTPELFGEVAGDTTGAHHPVCTVRHGITHHRIELRVFAARLVCTAAAARRAGLLAVAPDDTEASWSTPARKAFAALRGGTAKNGAAGDRRS